MRACWRESVWERERVRKTKKCSKRETEKQKMNERVIRKGTMRENEGERK